MLSQILSAEVVAILTSLAVFALVLSISVIRDRLATKNNPRIKAEDKWLFSDWSTKMYYTFTKNKPEIIARKLGIDVDRYIKDCILIREKIKLEDVITKKIIGYIVVLGFGMLGVITKNMYVTLIGMILGYLPTYLPMHSINNKAKLRRCKITEEMSRFMDLLQTALYINIPIEEAIEMTSKHLEDTVISEEFKAAAADTILGTYNWQKALEELACRFEIDVFSDFVLDLTTAYSKGLNIYEVIVRKNKDIKQTNLFLMREKAAKINSQILIPMTVFKLIPLLIMLCVPIILQLKGAGF